MIERDAHLVLADGVVFEGRAIGAEGTAVGEAVFTTGMTGYEEVLTDPSFCHQIVCMTAPQIGNTGATDEDHEAGAAHLAGFVVHELSRVASSWRAERTLDEQLRRLGVPGIAGVDTRALTRHIRDRGAQLCAIGTEGVDALLERARSAPPMAGLDLTGRVTTGAPYEWREGSGAWRTDRDEAGLHVAVLDYGVKRSLLRCLADLGCRLTVLPATASSRDVLALDPDGVFLSNGPGDPGAVARGVETVRGLIGERPLFGVCLGHQLLALALGASTFKLKFGHRGLNHPVKDLTTGRIEITAQNHGFAVDLESLPASLTCTHVHLNDGTCQGVEHPESGAFGVQFHPEASAGPHDSRGLFRRFVERMRA